ncbi:hypothetical protein SASPL_116590 [Salvia splendens]|uniref:Myb/SANT-like domain-containing protein n=1 Tax=Salvia splendens TaxID=180675 RepID=A0A8X8XT88_SALSN|nr:hypothetical protein SASPL_116590 [Salvia splendens]
MKPIMPHYQEVYLYFDGWHPGDNSILLDFMLDRKVKAEGAGELEVFGEDFLVEAHEELSEVFSTWKDLEDIYARVKFLRKRYDTFTFVINHEGAIWEVAASYVRASDNTWKAIMMVNDFVLACYLQDELEYVHLTRVFGPDQATTDGMGEVVEPSDTDDEFQVTL